MEVGGHSNQNLKKRRPQDIEPSFTMDHILQFDITKPVQIQLDPVWLNYSILTTDVITLVFKLDIGPLHAHSFPPRLLYRRLPSTHPPSSLLRSRKDPCNRVKNNYTKAAHASRSTRDPSRKVIDPFSSLPAPPPSIYIV